MSKPDELEIINIFQKKFSKKRHLSDDVEILKIGKSRIALKSDMLVQSTDVPKGMKLQEIARKSMVSCISDFACKGIKPLYATIALAIPSSLNQKAIKQLATGFSKASKEFGVQIVGGDTNQGKEIVIEVSVIGEAKNATPKRTGARTGDIIATSGPFGYSTSGLNIILNRYKAKPKFASLCISKVMNPKAPLEFGMAAAGYFTSSMDSSDGLSITLNEMSKQSKKKFVIFGLPTKHDVVEFASRNKLNLNEIVFCGGEEYETVFTTSHKNLRKIKNIAKKLGVPLFVIGYVATGKNVVLVEETREKTLKRCGWIHLRS